MNNAAGEQGFKKICLTTNKRLPTSGLLDQTFLLNTNIKIIEQNLHTYSIKVLKRRTFALNNLVSEQKSTKNGLNYP